jgi:hypothetical protein
VTSMGRSAPKMVLNIAVQSPPPFDSSKRNKGLSNGAYSSDLRP